MRAYNYSAALHDDVQTPESHSIYSNRTRSQHRKHSHRPQIELIEKQIEYETNAGTTHEGCFASEKKNVKTRIPER